MLRRLPSELPLLRRPRGPMATTVVSRTSRVSSEHTHDPRQNMYQPYRVYSTAYRILSETVRVLTSRHYSLGVVLLGYSAQSQSRRTASGAARRERRGPDGTGDPHATDRAPTPPALWPLRICGIHLERVRESQVYAYCNPLHLTSSSAAALHEYTHMNCTTPCTVRSYYTFDLRRQRFSQSVYIIRVARRTRRKF